MRGTAKQSKLAADPATSFRDLSGEVLGKIAKFLPVADRRSLRLASKDLIQILDQPSTTFTPRMQCVDADELTKMRTSKSPCENTARVVYKPKMNMQRAIICAIMSPGNKLHVYVDRGDLAEFERSESVKCFDKHYALSLALLYHRDPAMQEYPEPPPPKPEELRCAGGFRALKVQVAEKGRYDDEGGVQVVRFGGSTMVEQRYNTIYDYDLFALLDVSDINDIRYRAFANCKRLSVVVGGMQTLRFIGYEAFTNCTSLRRLGKMPNLVDLGDAAFGNCVKLLEFDAPNIEEIGSFAFSNCLSLSQLGDMPHIRIIEQGAFFGCESLAQISFGKKSSLEEIFDSAFEDCEKLQKVRLPNTLRRVGDGAFKGCPLRKLTVQRGADFECACMTLVKRLRLIKKVQIIEPKDYFSPRWFRIQTPIVLSTVPGRSNDNPIDLS